MFLPNQAINNSTNKNFNYKVVYNLRINNEKVKKRVITKIPKLDENNQYGMTMAKPLPNGCIKDDKDISKIFGKYLIFYWKLLVLKIKLAIYT